MAVPIFMIISGFVYSKSYTKKGIASFEDAYNIRNTLNKMIRYTVPFIITFVIKEIAFGILGIVRHNVIQIASSFLNGGMGPGSYYYPVMMQFVFYFPIIYMLIKKYDFNGMIVCAFINVIYEVLKWAYGMNEGCYRLLVFRYTLLIAYGCYLSMGNCKKNVKSSFALMMIGIIYIVFFRYLGFKPLVTNFWTGTCFWACLFIIPISEQLLISNRIKNSVIETIGKASYNIFLVQMVYYNVAGIVYEYIANRFLQLLVNIVICVLVGVFFYFVETPVTHFINRKVYILVNKGNEKR